MAIGPASIRKGGFKTRVRTPISTRKQVSGCNSVLDRVRHFKPHKGRIVYQTLDSMMTIGA